MFFVAEFINPICLPPLEFEEQDFVGYSPLVAGWDRSEDNRRTLVSIIIFVRLSRDNEKTTKYKNIFSNNFKLKKLLAVFIPIYISFYINTS